VPLFYYHSLSVWSFLPPCHHNLNQNGTDTNSVLFGRMNLFPYVYSVQIRANKQVHVIRILQEGCNAWEETDAAAALEENGLFALTPPVINVLGGKSCMFVAIDPARTNLSSMYSAEELPATDTETHRWCTYRVITHGTDGTLWLPLPVDAVIPPFPLGEVLRSILKAHGVELLNGRDTA
jgi:hypothetical protein